MTDPRDLIQRLLGLATLAVDEALDMDYGDPEDRHIYRELQELKPLVAEYLATPEPAAGPTDEELYDYWINTSPEFGCADPVGFARAVLARYGHQPPQPIPLSERLPTEADCDAEGRCWYWDPDEDNEHWDFMPRCSGATVTWTHWLPHHALPLPELDRHG